MYIPLAERMRPNSIDEVFGQDHLLGDKGFIRKIIEQKRPLSILFWGPPGCGKTTLARIYANAFNARFIPLSAVSSGVADVKKIIEDIQSQPLFSQLVMLFVDEIHRYNKAQQDLFLPYLEKGLFILIGATTENPSFTINNALLSRLRVLTLNSLDENALNQLLNKYENAYQKFSFSDEARSFLINSCQGDGRYLLNMIENFESQPSSSNVIDIDDIKNMLQRRSALYDKQGEGHYNLISALHKSVRGSDPDASLYWFCRMLEGGEDPLFIARRIIRMASEDIGMADPQALQQAIAARDAYQMLGSPEGELALAQAVIYMALAPKSNAIYTAYNAAKKDAHQTGNIDPPQIILNAPTKLMSDLGYGEGYIYDHDTTEGFSGQNYFPDELERKQYYHPVERGFEREMLKRINYFSKLRKRNH